MKTKKTHLFILILLFIFSLPCFCFAQENLKDYSDNIVNVFKQETKTINSLVDDYNNANFEYSTDIISFKLSLTSYEDKFESYLSFYNKKMPSSAPSKLTEAVEDSKEGTIQIKQSIKTTKKALDEKNNSLFEKGQEEMNNGIDRFNIGVDKYNKWTKDANLQSNTIRSNKIQESENLGFNNFFSTTWSYTKFLSYIYIYLFIIGVILTLVFHIRLRLFTSGKNNDFKGAPVYGIHLFLLLPFFYLLLILLLLIVIDIFLLGVMYLFYSPTIHFGILIGIGVIIFGTLHGILKGLFVRQKRGNALAKSVKREQEPKLWQISDNVAKKVGTKPVDEIHISPESGIGVHLSGDFFTLIFGRTRRILTVGMPSIASLTIDEMKAILAHECGHFSNKDTSWNSVTFTMAGALENTLESIPKPLNYGSTNIFYTIIIALNPALWIVRAYKFLFLVFTSGFSRMREVLADKTAVEFFGYKNFSSGLRKIARNDYLFANYYVPELIGLLREQDRTFKNIFEFMDDNYKRFNKDLIQEIDESILKKEKKSIFNSHPPIKQRMVYARNFNTQYDNHSGKKEFKSIFSNWNKLTLEMSDLYAYYIKLFL